MPFLGICLGLQGLFESSEEAPEARGLGIFPGDGEALPDRMPASPIWAGTKSNPARLRLTRRPDAHPYVYFAHSYYVPETN